MGNITVKTPTAIFKGHIIVKTKEGYVVNKRVYKTLSAATDTL